MPADDDAAWPAWRQLLQGPPDEATPRKAFRREHYEQANPYTASAAPSPRPDGACSAPTGIVVVCSTVLSKHRCLPSCVSLSTAVPCTCLRRVQAGCEQRGIQVLTAACRVPCTPVRTCVPSGMPHTSISPERMHIKNVSLRALHSCACTYPTR